MMGLTIQQSATLHFIERYVAERDLAPTFEEIREHLGLASKSGVHRLLTGLEERGRVTWRRNTRRSIRLLNPDESLAQKSIEELRAELAAIQSELRRRTQ